MILNKHPFPVEAHFDNSTVLTFAVPKEELQSLIPDCLELDTYNDKWAFLAVAMVQSKNLRPKGLPTFMGHDFFLIGYRIFVRYTNSRGKRLRGLYIIKSETNKLKMQIMGNIFTQYNYTTTDIGISKEGSIKEISSNKSKFSISIDESVENTELPEHSPFNEWKEARRFAGPLPFTFTYNKDDNSILIIEGVRTNWNPKAIDVSDYNFDYLNSLEFKTIVLANAFEITNVPYHWKKGKIEKLEKWN